MRLIAPAVSLVATVAALLLGGCAVPIVSEPRDQPYGRVCVFLDISGNRWDLLDPRP